ncbi:MAG: tRNA (adenosine(37)-N6)-threonylcarbamoyltransferase complex dimerization subunit type 1 TsaB [Herpetosiphonaceae bacterium]|nr:MAG: tRNA (adenosine(37)-N6)-threonylcarbamoyltransferase complex dimerization subunit type 1 TsaB [Herpetosiphonaceae bacterium]
MLLAVDTSTDDASVALYSKHGLLAERTWRSGRRHSEQILPAIDDLLRDIGAGPEQIEILAVALGPGSWSGLRVGLSLVKGVAVTRGLPVVGVGSLEILAYPHQRVGRPVVPVIKMGRDRYAVVEYRLRRRWGPTSEPRNVSLDELVAAIPEVALVCGDLSESLVTAIRRVRDEGVIFATPALNLRRAGYLAEIAWLRHSLGDYDDLISLEPIYLGSPVRS